MDDYPIFHQDRGNLLIHIVAVPLFDLTTLAALWSLLTFRWLAAALFVSTGGWARALRRPVP